MTIVAFSVTEAGRALAARLPYERVHGSVGPGVRDRWETSDGFVLILASGAAVRIVAPLLSDKHADPPVVCVDEAGRYAVALCGGHSGGANALAREVAQLLGAEPVVTTATDVLGLPALDLLPGFFAAGDIAGVTRARLDGRHPTIETELDGWPVPAVLVAGDGPDRLIVTDRVVPAESGVVALHPPSLVIGVGTSTNPPPEAIFELVASTLSGARLAWASVAEVATIDRRATDPAITSLGLPVRSYSAEELAVVAVPTASAVVEASVGTPSVAEAAALLAAGPGAELIVPKQKNLVATVSVARRRGPRGCLTLVGLGPGATAHRTPAAAAAVRSAEVVIGYSPYIDQASDLLHAAQQVVRSPIGSEVHRARSAITEAAAGRSVVMVSSGDIGVYAMASIVFEEAGATSPDLDITVLPGVTASLAASALLGAPLGHDHVSISLSDLLTPWSVIEERLRAAAGADFVVALYNPRSKGRTWQLEAARDLLLAGRPSTTPVGIVTDAFRPGETVAVTTLGKLDPELVGMTTCVVVGSSKTRVVAGRMVTPRGYRP